MKGARRGKEDTDMVDILLLQVLTAFSFLLLQLRAEKRVTMENNSLGFFSIQLDYLATVK